jgi:hypothetical protein
MTKDIRSIPERVEGESWTYTITLEDVARRYPPKTELMGYEPKYEGEILALGRAVYETQPQESTDMLLRLTRYLGDEYAPGNFWLLPTHERMPYPFAVYWPLACAFETEKTQGRRFDWFLWMDDDVMARPEDFIALRSIANEHLRPFVAAVPYDRFPPHCPAVTEFIDGEPKKWITAPESGTYAVSHVGLCMALFHRSLFDKVPEPWFGVSPPTMNRSGMNPDYWWSVQMNIAGIQPHVCCDTNVDHLGRKLHVNRAYSQQWQDVSPRRKNYPEILEVDRLVSPQTGASVITPPKPRNGRRGD